MTDLATFYDVSDDDVANLWTYLLGGQFVTNGRDPAMRQASAGGASLLRRLLQTFQGDPCGSQNNLAIPAAATRLTPTDGANSATVTVEGAGVRVTFDGSAPSATNGLVFASGSTFTITGRPSMQGAQFFQQGAGAIIQVAYFT